VAKREARETLLQGVIRAFGLRPTHIVRVARRLARELGIPSISRYHLTRLSRGEAAATEDRIFIIVAAIREITDIAFRAADLFRLEPEATRDAVARRPRRVEGAGSSNLYVPIFSPRNGLSRAWRIFVPEETGMPPDDSFETLYREYGVVLRVIAIRRYGIPPDDAEAIVHDTFVGYLQRHTYIRDVKGWLLGATRHKCVDYWRAREREAPLLPEHDETVDQRPEAAHERLMRELTVSAVLARLGLKCRETLRRFFFEGEHQDALADRLSTTPGYIDQLISTCRRRAMELFRSLNLRIK
jgi:RNA polymerase sigma factor (sigma-70 family)